MKAKCPECKSMNRLNKICGGFYFNVVEFTCDCGFKLISYALNFTDAIKLIKKELRKKMKKKFEKETLK